jgi:Secretion system C-terminal sorting domain
MTKCRLISVALLVLSFPALSQQMMSITPKKPIVCYLEAKDKHTFIAPPEAYLKSKNNTSARTSTATFEVQYVGFDAQSKNAFQQAVDIWSTLIQSPVKIKIRAVWQPLASGVLGSAIWANAYANFPNAQKLNTFYPVALAEKIAGKDLNHPDSVDIYANFSSSTSWSYGVAQAGKTDLVSVVLHEIGHGLGITDSYDSQSGQGAFGLQGSGVPMVYDLSIENLTNQNLFQTFTSPSAELNAQLIGNNLFYSSPLATTQNGGQRPKVYAPAAWSGGSSIAHLNENTYPSGDPNSLMTPFIGTAEVMLNPGPIVLNIFNDMGWVGTRIDHTPVNKESFGATTLIAKVESDNTYDPAKVKLVYTKQSGGTETSVVGTPTANANEFSFSIPASTSTDTIFYLISATDNISRVFTNPGKFTRPKNTELQGKFIIGIGPDTKAPTIVHMPKAFLQVSSTSLSLDAVISDNIGIQEVFVDYSINNGASTSLAMTQSGTISKTTSSLLATYSSSYTATINFLTGVLKDGDIITYKIRAKDNSAAQNVGYSPSSTTSYEVKVVGLAATQDSYQNNFDDLVSSDFFGDTQFSIIKPAGFNNGAIHSVHPYPEAGTGNLNFIYELRIPIRVKAQDATIKFDEIVLAEPGTTTTFPSVDFFDYVIVEGSKNGGTTWTPVANGWDSRDNADWLARYNSSIIANISQGVGDPSLFRPRVLNLLNKFAAGDEVVIRFRLFSDPGAAGWGWAIDNLKIQIDDTPPTLAHNHIDYSIGATAQLPITVKATDNSGLKTLSVEYKVNNGTATIFPFPISNGVSQYTLNLDITPPLQVGDEFQYRIRSSDMLNNEVVLPATDFFRVPIISTSTTLTKYVSDFNSANTDFVGNFFSISTPTGFSNGAIHSSHSYLNGFGLTNSSSSFTYTLARPIIIDATNPYMVFDEIGIIEPINDYAIVEGSKNNGVTWQSFLVQYSASAQSNWLSAYNAKSKGSSSLFKSRLINLTQNGNFKAGDQVLIRFRLNANATINAWGWAIDNLSIQGPVTGLENATIENSFSAYPNPTDGSKLTVKFNTNDDSPVQIQFLSSHGSVHQSLIAQPVAKAVEQEFSVEDWPNGLYIIKAEVNGNILTKKIIKSE